MDANEAGIEALIKNDPDMARAFKLAGKPPSRKRAPGFSSLLRTIVNQQVSVHAAQAIWEKRNPDIRITRYVRKYFFIVNLFLLPFFYLNKLFPEGWLLPCML